LVDFKKCCIVACTTANQCEQNPAQRPSHICFGISWLKGSAKTVCNIKADLAIYSYVGIYVCLDVYVLLQLLYNYTHIYPCSKDLFPTGLPQVNNISVVDRCESDFTIEWISTNYDHACKEISYAITLTVNNSSPDKSNQRSITITTKSMNFTELTGNILYYVTVQAISMGGRGDAVTQCVHTLDATSTLPDSKPFYFNKIHTQVYVCTHIHK